MWASVLEKRLNQFSGKCDKLPLSWHEKAASFGLVERRGQILHSKTAAMQLKERKKSFFHGKGSMGIHPSITGRLVKHGYWPLVSTRTGRSLVLLDEISMAETAIKSWDKTLKPLPNLSSVGLIRGASKGELVKHFVWHSITKFRSSTSEIRQTMTSANCLLLPVVNLSVSVGIEQSELIMKSRLGNAKTSSYKTKGSAYEQTRFPPTDL